MELVEKISNDIVKEAENSETCRRRKKRKRRRIFEVPRAGATLSHLAKIQNLHHPRHQFSDYLLYLVKA
jgi:hypothetical protein